MSMDLKEAREVIGIDVVSIENIMDPYVKKITETDDLDLKIKLTQAKFILFRQIVAKQIEENGSFDLRDVTLNPVVGDLCTLCHGSGEIYKFLRTAKFVPCNVCNGKRKEVECRSCHGTGRYKKSFSEGLKINVECKSCHGTGKFKLKCRACRGTGKRRVFSITPVLESTTVCPKCEGQGFKPPKKLMNPVLPRDIATFFLL